MAKFDNLDAVFETLDISESSEIIGGKAPKGAAFWGALSDIASALEGNTKLSTYKGMSGRGW